MRVRADLFFTHMATTADPLVGFRCSFVLWASGSGVQGQIREAKRPATDEIWHAELQQGARASSKQAPSNQANKPDKKEAQFARVAGVSVPFQAYGMQPGSGLVRGTIVGPIPRDERALRHQELLEMVCYVHQGSRPHLVRLSH